MVVEHVVRLTLRGPQTPAMLQSAVLRHMNDQKSWHIDWARYLNGRSTAYAIEPPSKEQREFVVPIYRIEDDV